MTFEWPWALGLLVVVPLLAGASPAERAVLSASLASLFSTIQLLGAEPDQEPRLGGLLDTLA